MGSSGGLRTMVGQVVMALKRADRTSEAFHAVCSSEQVASSRSIEGRAYSLSLSVALGSHPARRSSWRRRWRLAPQSSCELGGLPWRRDGAPTASSLFRLPVRPSAPAVVICSSSSRSSSSSSSSSRCYSQSRPDHHAAAASPEQAETREAARRTPAGMLISFLLVLCGDGAGCGAASPSARAARAISPLASALTRANMSSTSSPAT